MTFVEAHKNLRRFRAEASFGAWLHGIAFRQAYNYLRKARRRRWLGLDEFELDGSLEEAGSLEERTIRRQLLGVLYAAMDRLPPNQRIAFGLHVFEGLGLTEIGSIVGASPQTIRARILSARQTVLKHFRRATRANSASSIMEQLV